MTKRKTAQIIHDKAWWAAYREANREKLREYQRNYMAAYRVANPDKCHAAARAHHVKHREKRNAYAKINYAIHHAERLAYASRYHAEHLEECRASCRASYVKHREKRLAGARAYIQTERGKQVNRHNVRRHNALKRQTSVIAPDCVLTRHQWVRIVQLSNGKCYWCHRKMQKATQDHVIPLRKGGLHTASNVVASCLSCNASKGAKVFTLF